MGLFLLLPLVQDALASHSGARVVSGAYTGDGTAGRAITGVGFTPNFLIIKGNLGQSAIARSITMVGDSSKELGSNVQVRTNLITSLDADGFTVGTDVRVNGTSTVYYWTAFDVAPGEMKADFYIGDGTDDRSITGVGFQPDYVIVMSEGGDYAQQRFALENPGYSLEFKNTAERLDRIQAFEPDGFQVGTENSVNRPGTVIHYVAWKASEDAMAIKSFVGDETDNRDIEGFGFAPEFVLLKSSNTQSAFMRANSLTGDQSFRVDGGTTVADGIQALLPDGFQVGTSKPVNGALDTIYCAVFRGPDKVDMAVAKSANTTSAALGDTIAYKIAVTNNGLSSALLEFPG